MSCTMTTLRESRKAVHSRSTERSDVAHVAHDAEQAAPASRAVRAERTESLAKDLSYLTTLSGFVVLDREGEFLAWSATFEAAITVHRKTKHASQVRRCSDDVVLMFRQSKQKAHRWEEPVPA